MIIKRMLAVLVCASGMLGTQVASASSVSFDFTNGTTDWTYYTQSYEADGLTLDVSSYRQHDVQGLVKIGRIRQMDGLGLEIKSSPRNTGQNEIDGAIWPEAVRFSFSENIILEQVRFETNGFTSSDNFNFLANIDGSGRFSVVAEGLRPDFRTDIHDFLGSLLLTGSDFAIGAFNRASDFHITGVTVGRLSVIPLPAALPLYGAGVAILGFIGWRRKSRNMA